MHSVYKPGKAPNGYNFEEYCPHCDNCIPVVVDDKDFVHYEFKCPVCGNRLMLCKLCHDDGGVCNWNEESGCFRMERGLDA